ncbi:MAG: transcription antitermination factor NusB [Eubacterium sp.]|nr:transcription antitermination factor NusB [Eubacterium sp.]
MNRYKQREQAFALIFQSLFSETEPQEIIDALLEDEETVIGDYSKQLFFGVCEKKNELDEIISEFSTGWKLNRISKVNLSILRLAVYEMKYIDDVPDSVAINEAVELAKRYSTKEDSSFVNGILGSFSRSRA